MVSEPPLCEDGVMCYLDIVYTLLLGSDRFQVERKRAIAIKVELATVFFLQRAVAGRVGRRHRNVLTGPVALCFR